MQRSSEAEKDSDDQDEEENPVELAINEEHQNESAISASATETATPVTQEGTPPSTSLDDPRTSDVFLPSLRTDRRRRRTRIKDDKAKEVAEDQASSSGFPSLQRSDRPRRKTDIKSAVFNSTEEDQSEAGDFLSLPRSGRSRSKMGSKVLPSASEESQSSGFSSLPRSDRPRRHTMKERSNMNAKAAALVSSGFSDHPIGSLESERASFGNGNSKSHNDYQEGQVATSLSEEEQGTHPGAFRATDIDGENMISLESTLHDYGNREDASQAAELRFNVRLQSGSEMSAVDLERQGMNLAVNPSMAAPVSAELAPSQEILEARITQSLEQRYEERLREELRIRSEADAYNNPMVVEAQAVQMEEDVNRGISEEQSTGTRSSFWCKSGLVILMLVVLVGVGVGVWIAVGNGNNGRNDGSNNNDQKLTETPTGIPVVDTPTSMPSQIPTTNAPSQTPSIEPTMDEFSVLLNILEPILAESPTFHNRTYFQDPSTVQFQVLDWIAMNAPLEIDVACEYTPLARAICTRGCVPSLEWRSMAEQIQVCNR